MGGWIEEWLTCMSDGWRHRWMVVGMDDERKGGWVDGWAVRYMWIGWGRLWIEGWIDYTAYHHQKICAQMDPEAPEERFTHLKTQPPASSAPWDMVTTAHSWQAGAGRAESHLGTCPCTFSGHLWEPLGVVCPASVLYIPPPCAHLSFSKWFLMVFCQAGRQWHTTPPPGEQQTQVSCYGFSVMHRKESFTQGGEEMKSPKLPGGGVLNWVFRKEQENIYLFIIDYDGHCRYL